MAKAPKTVKQQGGKSLSKILVAIPLLAFIVKLSVISRIQGLDWYGAGNGNISSGLKLLIENNYAPAHVWYGADAENYLRSVIGLFSDGLFSTERNLHYWPAGYPILIWMVGLVGQGAMLALVAVLQSLLYFIACAFFTNEIRQTRLTNFALPIAILLTLNPTLALNTISIGYELPTASLALIALSSLVRHFRLKKNKVFTIEFFVACLSMSLATFMQPRLAILSLAFFIIWATANSVVKLAALTVLVSMIVTLIGPALMIYRNDQAMGFRAISTNLGVTMNIGAGDEATGGYNGKYNGVPCPEAIGNEAQVDSAKVKCVLSWYLNNPFKFLKLSWNKAIYYWSPWFGPVANGTMARNPWRVNHPFNETIKTQSGANLIYGSTGKVVSWLWMLVGLIFLVLGFRFLWSAGGLERLWATASIGLVILNWLSSIATIGDNRFRIPTMTLSLILQAVGFYRFLLAKRKRLVGSTQDVTWPGLHWKPKSESDNLPT